MSGASGDRLGATAIGDATRFEVWAPTAERVEIVFADGPDHERRVELATHEAEPGLTTWVGAADGIGSGDRYLVSLDGGDPLPDPASRWQPDGVHGPSAVVDAAGFAWSDDGWTGVSLADTVLYELHVGTFTPAGTFDAAIGQLDRLARLGVTMVEVMPVNAFPGERNWGYDGVFPYAVQQSYGGPAGFARFVDAAHSLGLGVVLDVVYNHIGPEGNVLPRFGPYFTDQYHTPWGSAVNVADADSNGVRRYLVENAVGWIEDFHLDGLRVDAVHAIVDPTARPMMEELVAAVHGAAERAGRVVLVTLESAANDPRMVRSTDEHGWGADAVWNDDVHHALRVALTGERHEYYAAYTGVSDLATALDRRWVYDGQYSPTLRRRHGAPAGDIEAGRFIVFASNHDHAGNTPQGRRMLRDDGPTDPRRRLAAAFVLLSPFTPLLFMGSEYAEPAPFPYFVDHGDPDLVEAVRAGRQREFAGADWAGGIADPGEPATFEAAVLDPSIAESGPHRQVLDLYTELLRIRREVAVLTDPAADQLVLLDDDVLTVVRTSPSAVSVMRCNFGEANRRADDTELPLDLTPERLVFDSSATEWGGDGAPADQAIAPFSARLWVTTRTP